MKKVLYLLSLVLTVLSCGPSRYAIHVEMRHPSRSGIELAGKLVSVVCIDSADSVDRVVCENMADGFARALEEGYGTGEGSIGLYCVQGDVDDYANRDSLVNLLIQTGSDVVFLMDVTSSGELTSAGQQKKVSLYCYDGMDKDETVRHFTGTKVLPASSKNELTEEAVKAGKVIAEPFESQWKHEQYSVTYYDNPKWYEALVKADQYDWKGAMEIWFDLLDTNDALKRASAEYNIAVACYMMGDFDLAVEWLDRSDTENKLPTLSDALRKRIEARKR